MALVFVHGIGNRSGAAYDRKVAFRDALFRRFLLDRAFPELTGSPILNPVWGGLGARLAWDHASAPGIRPGERLGPDDPFVADVMSVTDPGRTGQPLVRVARDDLRDAIDLLYTMLDLRGRGADEITDLADLAADLVDWCDRQEGAEGPRLGPVDDDRELLELLVRAAAPQPAQAEGSETLGGRRRVREVARAALVAAVNRYRQQNVGPPVRYAAAALRRLAGRPISLLIGDVMVYLGGRGTPAEPGPIVALVAAALDAGRRDGPLVVVAHSMGGNIAYDVLSHFRPDIQVDTLITVGSQVGLFEELKLFGGSDPAVPDPRRPLVAPPANVTRWINVVDRGDVLAYRAAPIFGGAEDYDYPSDAPWAHGAYFQQPNFHARLAERARKAR
ncbi:hypothetical protein [Dactylosporangium sp. NPDC049140]|uniref:hypothetical protein n=1 Tax=Dactylosporangium sp. NPDC049140 TaxID=3155647 RepID=UPI0033E62E42